MSTYNKFRYKGKLVSESRYKWLKKLSESGKKRKKLRSPSNPKVSESKSEQNLYQTEKVDSNLSSGEATNIADDTESVSIIENVDTMDNVLDSKTMDGRRIVEVSVLGKQLWCTFCKEALSLEYTENEIRRGLGSILLVRCHKCLILNTVTTGKQHTSPDGRTNRFDVNTKIVLGFLSAGVGWTHLNKILGCLNIPTICFSTYKRYEDEVGHLIEKHAKESCVKAAGIERELTMRDVAEIEKLLPENLKKDFIMPGQLSGTESSQISSSQETLTATAELQEKITDEPEEVITFDDVVRIMVSYDMGWSRRGTGRSYDSLNGFGALIGLKTGLILDYGTCNRKCKRCDMGQDPRNHDCRRNFWGSAKAMEPHVAKNLVNSSEVLKSQNLQVGVLIGDDDSSTIAACRSTSSHPIVKFSDKNHASGGVTKELYKIANNRKHRELTKDGIMYLHRCFTYAMSTNKGDSEGMAKTIRCIPYHAFNDHNQCGDWCGYLSDPENYDHSMIPGGFHDQELFKHLKDLFDRLASNSQKFSPGASSNANESLHASMASVAPKSRCYSLTASSDYRFALTVGHKNEGPQFMQNVLKSAGLSPGKHFSKHIAKTQRVLQRRRILTKAPEYKKRRLALKKLRTALRHRKENVEGITYQSNCTLLDKPEEDRNNKTVQHTSSDEENNDESNPLIVLLDLETSGLNRDCDILQIAAKCGRASFSTYINPKKQISAAVTEANGLTNFQGVLLYHGLAVKSVTLRLAMSELHLWLSARSTPPYIATHNLSFDGPRFHDAIVSCNLQEEFQQVVRGFIDTLTVIRKVTERKKKGECSISGLANWLNIPTEGAHNAENDVRILQKILRSAKITHQNLIDSAKTWDEQTGIWIRDRDANRFLSNLAPLKGIVGDTIRKKLAYASITIDSLQQIFHDSGIPGIVQILTEKINGKPRVTSHKPSVEKITKWVEQNLNLNSRETPSSA